ncbi:protein kinase [Streptomyces sp. NPDC002838]|uniref:serine/threonine-protein kinase n=1 Tax=Streptomyces sp. NPDC002838 TaxID=3154436 RepID=UPI00331E291F
MSNDGDGADPKGVLLDGRYRLIERIGAGGMGTVWRARDEFVEREVAVKQPRLPGGPEDEEHRRAAHRLYREARAAARVDHPAAVSIHDVVVEEEDGLPWIVMELIRGESLHEALRRGPLPPAEAARIGLAVLGALRAAHAVGIVHRDIKPANVLLGPHHRVVLTDFGIAHTQGEESLTATGEFVGSLEFVAPERMAGTGAGPASDLWSLGVLLYTAVEDGSPFRRTTPEATLAAIVAADPPEPTRAGPLGPLITGLLAKEPERRPDAEEVARVLEGAAGERRPEGDVQEALPVDAVPLPDPESDSGPQRDSDSGPDADPAPDPEPDSDPAPDPEPDSDPAPAPNPRPSPTRRTLVRTAVASVGVLLAGGIWLGTSFADGTAGQGGWVAHREQGMNAVLQLPPQYKGMYQVGEAGDDSRLAVYGDGDAIEVHLTEWDKAPGSPMSEARDIARGREGQERSPGQYTPTTFHGHEAALSDVTYDPHGKPTRVMRLIVRTDDSRMYELRVDMPKGTPDEKKGTAVFKAARDRLEFGND